MFAEYLRRACRPQHRSNASSFDSWRRMARIVFVEQCNWAYDQILKVHSNQNNIDYIFLPVRRLIICPLKIAGTITSVNEYHV